MFDYVTIVERAAIKEFDGGVSRFQAETEAAAEIGKRRWEIFGANNKRNSQQGGDKGKPASRDTTGNLPPMQSHQKKQKGQVPLGDLQAGWNCLALLALPVSGWCVL